MEYLKGKAFLGDFAQRTIVNLDAVEKASDSYEITQLINSLLGLIIFPKERNWDMRYSTGWNRVLHKYVVYPKKRMTNSNLMRNLRNAVSHSHIMFEKDVYLDEYGKGQIKSISFISCDYINGDSPCHTDKDCEKCRLKNSSKVMPDFQLTIPVNELRSCIKDLAEELINTTKKPQTEMRGNEK